MLTFASGGTVALTFPGQSETAPAASFWRNYRNLCEQQDAALSRVDREQRNLVILSRVAALMQVLAPEPPSVRLGLVQYLSTVAHVEATHALARLAVYSPEDDVRLAAVDALKVRRERDYTQILVSGLRYPWPGVAKHAADAIVKLDRTDLIPDLVDLVEEADPRAPVIREVGGKKTPVVRELVRVNHHRSCLMCHTPGNTTDVSPETLTAGVPIPGEALLPPSRGYQTSRPDIQVRIDVTYLRQDFSMFHAVADANPWPETQRFDYLVRTREVTEEEAEAYRDQYARVEPGRPSAYQKVALAALREMTGRDAAPTAEAWRALLELPKRKRADSAP